VSLIFGEIVELDAPISGDLKPVAQVLDTYAGLLEHAFDIVHGAPYFASTNNEEHAILRIDGEIAILTWPRVVVDYDCPSLELESKQFDAKLLLLTPDALEAWKAEQQRLYDVEQARRREMTLERDRVRQENADRLAYERLKKKFG
jgi:hypothetical protein